MTSRLLNEIAGAELHFKCENMQKAGAFKGRGATNAIQSLSEEEARRGIATHSSGNHGSALAWAASVRGVSCTVVMPEDAPRVKVEAAKSYGARVVFCENSPESRSATLQNVVEGTGATVIHPYDNDAVIAGQGTTALELLEDHPDLDIVMAPVGGGGLISGIATVAKYQGPSAKYQVSGTTCHVIGAEPELADDAYRSMMRGVVQPPNPPLTIADGLRAGLCERTFTYMRELGVEVLTCTEENIRRAQHLIMSRMKTVVEPSGAVSFAVVLQHPERFAGKKVGVVITGGNLELAELTGAGE